MPKGNETENSSFLDVCFALKNNIFRTLNVADVCVVREINGDLIKCEYITSSTTTIFCAKLKNLTVKVNDVVLVVFTTNDFRTSLDLFKKGQKNTNFITLQQHDIAYGVVVGVIYQEGK